MFRHECSNKFMEERMNVLIFVVETPDIGESLSESHRKQ
jgi:hypothetical protein